METFNSVEVWLNNVAISHSNSEGTYKKYRRNFQSFCDFIGKTPQQILEECEKSSDRDFKKKYAQLLRAFRSHLFIKQLSPNTIHSGTTAVKSFFKYNDLPLGHVPMAQQRVLYHNRDITKKEIKLILDASRPREKAFYIIMAQSGLRPHTISHLKYKYIKEDFEKNTIPCKIDVLQGIAKGQYHPYFTFIGEEGVKYSRAYLNTRPNLKDDDYLFPMQGSTERVNPKSITGLFTRTVLKLQQKGLIDVKQEVEGKPRDIRFYNLRKFFRKYAHQAGFEFVQFWMGHTVKAGVDDHYRPQDVEFHRKLYKEKAMPFLRIETHTPTEIDKKITELEEENKKLGTEVAALSTSIKKYKQMETDFYSLLGDYNSWDDRLKKERKSWQELIRLQHKTVEAFRDEVEKLKKEKEKLEKKQKRK
jgi:integrase